MMVLNHGFSGYVCGRVAMPLLERHSPLSRRAMGWAFFLGAMLPDGDILVRVMAGRGAYFSGASWGHRQASHSILGTLLLAALAAAVLYGPWLWRTGARWRGTAWAVGCLWAGGLLHLVGDVFTPARPLALLWPLEGHWGGWSHIGWFSPYLLAMFLAVLLGDALLAAWARRGETARQWAGAAAWLMFAAAAWRWLQYLAVSRYESAEQWRAYQQSLLPEPLVAALTEGVAGVWSWMVR
jgi:membrane-bound metal-dependent hydrolase YbcI (DUF457 family)